MITGEDLGFTRLNESRIFVSPLPYLLGHQQGEEVVRALILHEYGHHLYHKGPTPEAIWQQAEREGLGRLLNLVADEHLERNLRARERRFGDLLKVLAAYAAEHGASRDRWLFLTGDKQALYDICIKGFKLPLQDDAGTPLEPITHSTRLVLVDAQGQIRGYYSGTEDEDLNRLAGDAKKLS